MKYYRLACILLLLTGCGYRSDGEEKISVSVPYVVGDHEGELTRVLASTISQNPYFRYTGGEGDWIVKAKVKNSINDRIGYRYDRSQTEGTLKSNVIGIENRKTITVEVTVVNSTTGKVVLGPQEIKAGADFDYINPNNRQDISFINPSTGVPNPSISFSLGQLDSVGSAGEDAIYPIHQKIATRIVEGMIASSGWDEE